MSLQTREYLNHILDETAYIMADSAKVNKADFLENETLKRAYVRSIEVIGKAEHLFQSIPHRAFRGEL
jgi:uncharacterized protein with HEPN domain